MPLDGSEPALRALGPGRRLASIHDARLVLVTVATNEVGGTTRATNVLAAGRLVAGSDVDTLMIEADDAASALAAFDADHPATLMCMTTRGRGALRRRLLGSAALDVVLPWVTRWAQRTDAALLLVHVVYPTAPPAAREPPSMERIEQLDDLPRLAEQLRAEHADVRHLAIPGADPAVAIREATDAYRHAMFAVATSHPTTAMDLLAGSTASEIIRNADIPVLVVSKTGTAGPPPLRAADHLLSEPAPPDR